MQLQEIIKQEVKINSTGWLFNNKYIIYEAI